MAQAPLLPSPEAHSLVLSRVARRCVEQLDIRSVSIVMSAGGGAWSPAHATDAVARQLEQFAYTVGEGPCHDALQAFAPVVVDDLTRSETAARWPAWAPEAVDLGVRSVAAVPIQAGAVTVGVLALYSTQVHHFDRARVAAAARLADAAFLGLLDILAGLNGHTAADGPTAPELAVLLRADVHRAAGMAMAQGLMPIDQALARLRAYSFSSGQPLSDVAGAVLARRLRLRPDGQWAQ